SELVVEAANGANIELFYYCPYHPEGSVARYAREHPTRKPAPGMLLQAARELDVDMEHSWKIGDQMRDIQAGAAASTRTILIRPDADRHTRYDFSQPIAQINSQTRNDDRVITPDFLGRNLIEAVRIIAKQRKPDSIEESR